VAHLSLTGRRHHAHFKQISADTQARRQRAFF